MTTEKKLRQVTIGTTSKCNASCAHCPTGKAETALLPSGVMSMALFEKIIDELAASGLSVWSNLTLGLFGDALLDPHVVERCRYARDRLPTAPLTIATNGAAFSLDKHGALKDHVTSIVLHMESLRPEIYDTMMAPLRLERVLPKVRAMQAHFLDKMTLGLPLNRLNIGERDAFAAFAAEGGANYVHFSAMSNRCSSQSIFPFISFASFSGLCQGSVAQDTIDKDLIIDWDGQVLLCCNDFKKEEPIGNIASQSLSDIMGSRRRADVMADMIAGRHERIRTCSKCLWDKVEPTLLGALDVRHLATPSATVA